MAKAIKLIRKASKYVRRQFKEKEKPELVYHDINHTERVVKYANRIARKNTLTRNEKFILNMAAWFHDVGYLEGSVQHEERSAGAVEKFLLAEHVNAEIVTAVKQAILATRIPQQPVTLVEQILCDADLFHLGTSSFLKRSKLLRKEIQYTSQVKIDKKEWHVESINFLTTHRYFTPYARKKLEKLKGKNLKKLVSRQKLEHEQV